MVFLMFLDKKVQKSIAPSLQQILIMPTIIIITMIPSHKLAILANLFIKGCYVRKTGVTRSLLTPEKISHP